MLKSFLLVGMAEDLFQLLVVHSAALPMLTRSTNSHGGSAARRATIVARTNLSTASELDD